uniref:Potassium channel domain-containing protein n=1 Tax=Acrobeloides nanus TaxID=290746 RepID=A0A914C9S1_9BILA
MIVIVGVYTLVGAFTVRYIEAKQINFEQASQESNETNFNFSDIKSAEYFEYWTLTDSILFCFTVITTIGYGNVAPETSLGRLFVIFYGLIGVPLTMIVMANLGKFIAEILEKLTKKLISFMRSRRHMYDEFGKDPKKEEITYQLEISLFITSLFIWSVNIWFGGKMLTVNQFVKNLGDQLNLDMDVLNQLNLDNFVENAIKVEAGELLSLRSRNVKPIKPIIATDFQEIYNEDEILYVDEDEQVITYDISKNGKILTLTSKNLITDDFV